MNISKGKLTENRILTEATRTFAQYGYRASSLRVIAKDVGIEVPGIYKYFPSKQALYDAVLAFALNPIKQRLQEAIHEDGIESTAKLPEDIMDIFARNPEAATLFSQCLTGSTEENSSILAWLDDFLEKGTLLMKRASMNQLDDKEAAIMMLNIFQLSTGYFRSSGIAKRNWGIDVQDEANIEIQKAMIKNFLIASLKQRKTL